MEKDNDDNTLSSSEAERQLHNSRSKQGKAVKKKLRREEQRTKTKGQSFQYN
jgi:hypothetical protein